MVLTTTHPEDLASGLIVPTPAVTALPRWRPCQANGARTFKARGFAMGDCHASVHLPLLVRPWPDVATLPCLGAVGRSQVRMPVAEVPGLSCKVAVEKRLPLAVASSSAVATSKLAQNLVTKQCPPAQGRRSCRCASCWWCLFRRATYTGKPSCSPQQIPALEGTSRALFEALTGSMRNAPGRRAWLRTTLH